MAFEPLSALADLGGKLIERLWPDPAQRSAAQLELFKLQQSGELAQIAGQMKVNEIEAASPNIFVSGWRPFVGWVCGSGLAIQFVLGPLVTGLSTHFGQPVIIPPLDMETLLTCLGGLLGIGGLRTYEKVKGVAAK